MYKRQKLYSEATDITEEEASPIVGRSSSADEIRPTKRAVKPSRSFNLIAVILNLLSETSYYIKQIF